jgi:hypothetical protein
VNNPAGRSNPWLDRRAFLQTTAGIASAVLVPNVAATLLPGRALAAPGLVGGLKKAEGPTPIEGASWYVAQEQGDGIAWQFPAGTLAKVRYLTADMLLDGETLVVFNLYLQEGEHGRRFQLTFGGLDQCSFRVRAPLALTDQNRWMIEREGAFLKPMAGGDRVDLDKVDRVTLAVIHKAPGAVRWAMTELHTATEDVPKHSSLVLPKGKLLDEFGQSAQRDWPARTRSADELKRRLQSQFETSSRHAWPEGFSKWGGAKTLKLGEGTGFFRTHHDGRRWWFVDPDGYAFWSAGLDCVRVDCESRYDGLESALTWLPDHKGQYRDAFVVKYDDSEVGGKLVNYLAANFIRSFGADGWRDKWASIALAEMKRLRFNTVGNWSEWQFAAKAKFPYVRPMGFRSKRSGFIYRDFPDVFHAQFEADATEFASQLASTASDPAFIGYFLMNEPTWGFSTELPAAGMLYTTATCATRTELGKHLKKKYATDDALAAAWKMPVSFAKAANGKFQGILSKEAQADLQVFSVLMVERYFEVLSRACRKVDPNHLNLGMRWAGVPPAWAVRGVKFFDVFSMNCYMQKLPRQTTETIQSLLNMPVMVGEYHFGALDVGLPASGIGHVKTQADRARAYRVYLEDCAANPNCVGAHWFTLYDESALGRFDGENYNIGFLDVCNRPYDEIGQGAIAAHESVYDVAAGNVPAFADAPEYLPLVYL